MKKDLARLLVIPVALAATVGVANADLPNVNTSDGGAVASSDALDGAVASDASPQERCARLKPDWVDGARTIFRGVEALPPMSPRAMQTVDLAQMKDLASNVQLAVRAFKMCTPFLRADAGVALQEAAKSEAWIAIANAAIDTETKCRATPQCMTDRAARAREATAAAPVCEAVKTRDVLVQEMAHERANPSGVVDLARLHGLGASIQAIDDELPSLKASYAAVAHKPFALSACSP